MSSAPMLRVRYGNVSPASVGAIQRALLTLESQGGGSFPRRATQLGREIMRGILGGILGSPQRRR